jgi:hypothetical protein
VSRTDYGFATTPPNYKLLTTNRLSDSIMLRRFAGLWRHPDFIRLWAGQTISGFGSLIGATAIGFTAILVLHATPFQLGILAAVRLMPAFRAAASTRDIGATAR